MKNKLFVLILLPLAFILGAVFYPMFPDFIATHWNAAGKVDGVSTKFWGIFLLPVIMTVLAVFFRFIPRLDPTKNIYKFEKQYYGLANVILGFLFLIYLQTLLWNLGVFINPILVMALGLGVLFFYIGLVIEKTKRNWFVGIRTPWTLSSEEVWNKTHQLGGRLFKICGIFSLIGLFFKTWAILFILVPVISVSVYLVIYSYIQFQKEFKK